MSSTDLQTGTIVSLIQARREYLEGERNKWLSIDEAAYVLKTSKGKVLKMVHGGTVPVRREGKLMRIHVEDLRPKEGQP